MLHYLLFALGSFLLSLSLAWWLQRPDCVLRILDYPNHRSLHHVPTPRSGGLALVCGLLGGWTAMAVMGFGGILLWPVAGLLLVFLVGFTDDINHVPAKTRLFFHCCAAALLLPDSIWHLGTVEAVTLSALLLLAIAWMVNLYNFMDGMDGLAASMAVAGFGGMSLFGLLAQDPAFALMNLTLAAAAAGFLLFNLPRALLFLGDAGSGSLGYLAAAGALLGVDRGVFQPFTPLILFSPFIFDASFTLLRRLVSGERFWEAHRTHLYQRLVQSGWSHARVLRHALVLMALSVFCAWLQEVRGWPMWLPLGLILLALPGLVGQVERRVRGE